MRILQIITRMDSIGGAQRHVIELCQAAREVGHEVYLAYGGECALEAEEVEGVQLHPIASLRREISPVKDFAAMQDLHRLIKKMALRQMCMMVFVARESRIIPCLPSTNKFTRTLMYF